ncbi:MAG TPA: multidrug ABC transporter ATP-binding protein [Gammaproteobacteria bacterium]|nr:multidrug ABC transporter ATP-binding protein [Gammaproteobacteria bacterium]
MIRVSSLCRTYANFQAVDNVTFDVGKGEVVGLLGHNGAGKTTVMKMLTGFLQPSAGSVVIDNMEISEHRYEVQKLIGYLPENCPLYIAMTVIDYLDWMADLKGVANQEKPQRIAAAIAATELQQQANQHISTLSRGMRQRVGVAQAILNRPKVLILDEPTNGLDPGQIELMRLLIRQAASWSTVILSTHILQEVEAVCDRVLIMRGGQLVVDSTLESLHDSGRLLVKAQGGAGTIIPLLESIDLVASVESSTAQTYQVSVDPAQRDEASRKIVKMLVENDIGVSQIASRGDRLESLFRQES